jgi:hypothetical protein
MPNYQQGKIYCIRSHQTDDIYIGSTTQPLSRRMVNHRSDYGLWKEGRRFYTTSYELLQYDDCYIELIEECKCNSKMELEMREGQLIREMDCVNKCIPGRTKEEYHKQWCEENKEKIALREKQYREENKEKISQRMKEYYEENKERVLEHHKQYYEENKERLLEYQKQYREDNKERIAEHRKQEREKAIEEKRHYCSVCEHAFTEERKLRRHFNTIKHQQAITDKINSLDRFLYKQS